MELQEAINRLWSHRAVLAITSHHTFRTQQLHDDLRLVIEAAEKQLAPCSRCLDRDEFLNVCDGPTPRNEGEQDG